MAYYMRVLTPSKDYIPLEQLEARLNRENLHARFKVAGTNLVEWDHLVILDGKDREIAFLERLPVSKGSLGMKQINTFLLEITPCRPVSAVRRLRKYLKKVKVIYSFQPMEGADGDGDRLILGELMREIFESGKGIMQEDGIGFTNTEGFYILLFLPGGLQGSWPVAVYRWGLWNAFELDLGSGDQVADFHRGRVPKGATRL